LPIDLVVFSFILESAFTVYYIRQLHVVRLDISGFELKTFEQQPAGGGQHIVMRIVMVKEGDVNEENRADINPALAAACAQKGVGKRGSQLAWVPQRAWLK
jgi:hypothetical protein